MKLDNSYPIRKIEEGDFVKYVGCSKDQIRWGNNDDPEPFLVPGGVYYVLKSIIKSSHTKLILRGVEGKFNSVCFEKIS